MRYKIALLGKRATMRRLMLVTFLTGFALLLIVPLAAAQVTPPPVTGPDGQPVAEPQYTPSPPTQPPPTAARPTRTPSPCKCDEAVQPLPKPASFTIWWLILIPLYIIVMIIMYKLGAAGRSRDSNTPA